MKKAYWLCGDRHDDVVSSFRPGPARMTNRWAMSPLAEEKAPPDHLPEYWLGINVRNALRTERNCIYPRTKG